MAHGCVSRGVRRVPDGLARAPGALRGGFYDRRVPPVPATGVAECPGCRKYPEIPGAEARKGCRANPGRGRVAGRSRLDIPAFRAFAATCRLAPGRRGH